MATTWTFGVEPLAQTTVAADLLRRVTGLVLAAEGEEPAVARLIEDLRRAVDDLAARVPADPAPRVGAAADGNGRVYLDHGRDVGAYNPAFPTYRVTVDGDRAAGEVTFPVAYEGPPGVVHGGFLGLFFDCVVQHHHCAVGQAGRTTSLALRYRRPAPLLRPLAFALERTAGDGRLHTTGRLVDGDRLLCEAEVGAVAGDRAGLPAVSARRAS